MQMMFESDNIRNFLIESDGWVPVIASLGCDDKNVRESAVHTLFNITETELSHSKLLDGGVVPRLVPDFLFSSCLTINGLCCQAVQISE